MATAATKAANKANLEAAGRTGSASYTNPALTGVSASSSTPTVSSGGSNFVSTKGELLDATGKVVGQAPAGTTGTFTAGIAPTSAQGSASSTSLARPSSVKDITPGATQVEAPTNLTTSPTTPSATQATPEQVQQVAEATRQVNDLATRIKTGVSMAKAAEPNAPPTAGQAAIGIQKYTPGIQQEAPSKWPDVFQMAPELQTGFMDFDKWMSPSEQKKSLLQEYQEMSKSLGLDSLNQDLINEKAIIDGEEDAIRNEITAAGGIATDSQVQAIANARNKTRIKNYNKLIDLKTATMQQLDTMMDLSVQDRKLAEAEFDRKMNYAFKIQEFVQKSATDAKNTILSFADKVGWDTVMKSTTPYEQANMSKLFGVSTDMLRNAADESRKKKAEKDYGFQNVGGVLYRTDSKTGEAVPIAGSGDITSGQPVILQAKNLNETKQGLAQFTNNKDIPAAVREQIRKGIVVVNKLNEMVQDSPDGNFAGGRFRSLIAPLVPGVKEPKFQKLKTDEGKIRQDLVTYITGAAYTSLQEGDVNNMIPRSQLWDGQNQERTTNLANTIIGDIEAALLASGVNAQLPRFDDLFTSQLLSQASPEQVAELQNLGLTE